MKDDLRLSVAEQRSFAAQFQLLRSRVETSATGPCVIVVTSAEELDGTTLTATSLAECLARSGRTTALLTLDKMATRIDETQLKLASDAVEPCVPRVLAIPHDDDYVSHAELKGFLDSARASYEFLIVDAPAMLDNQRAVKLSELADGILLSVRLGRKMTDLDRNVLAIIRQSKQNVLGVVASTERAIRQCGRAIESKPEMLPENRKRYVPGPSLGRRVASSVFASAIALTLVFGSVVAFAALQPERYNSLAIVPAPARAVVAKIVLRLEQSRKL